MICNKVCTGYKWLCSNCINNEDNMNKNIKLQFKNGEVDMYITKSTDDIKLPSMGFKYEEDAELAIAIAKAIKARKGRDYWIEMHDAVKYVFRTLNLQDSGWT